jgi:hypothetical protein
LQGKCGWVFYLKSWSNNLSLLIKMFRLYLVWLLIWLGWVSHLAICVLFIPSVIYSPFPLFVSSFWISQFFCVIVLGFCFGGTKVWTQGFTLSKQVLYCLNHTSSPFFSEDGLLWAICPSWPWTTVILILASQVAKIIGMSHEHPARINQFFKWFYFISC